MDILLGAVLGLLLQDKDEKPENVTVQIQSTMLREKPSFQSAGVAEAKSGDTFKLIEFTGAWARVMHPQNNRVLYLHKSSVVDQRKFVPPPPEGSEGASGDVALATKGFTPQLEKERKEKQNLHAAYAKLDRIEGRPAYLKDVRALDARLARFAQEGNLKQ